MSVFRFKKKVTVMIIKTAKGNLEVNRYYQYIKSIQHLKYRKQFATK